MEGGEANPEQRRDLIGPAPASFDPKFASNVPKSAGDAAVKEFAVKGAKKTAKENVKKAEEAKKDAKVKAESKEKEAVAAVAVKKEVAAKEAVKAEVKAEA